MISKAKRKHKRVARKRVKDVESLKYQVNDIFNYIGNDINKVENSETTKLNKAELYDTYKVLLEGKVYQKDIIKILIYHLYLKCKKEHF
jgi:hypothetical protein